MLKIVIDSIKGKKLASNMIVFVKTNVNIDSQNNRLICAVSQSETEEGRDNFDWIGLNRQAVIQEKPELPKKATDLPAIGEKLVKEYITGLKLSNVISIESI